MFSGCPVYGDGKLLSTPAWYMYNHSRDMSGIITRKTIIYGQTHSPHARFKCDNNLKSNFTPIPNRGDC